jgi:hypothetical protein
MKALFLFLTVSLAIISCQNEKEIPKINPDEANRIKQKSGIDLNATGMLGDDTYYYKNTALFKGEATETARTDARAALNRELNEHLIPRLNEDIVRKYPGWQLFEQFCRDKKAVLSSRTNQFLAKQLLWAYDFYQKPYSVNMATTLLPYLHFLAEKEYRDFRLFYVYIKWFKDNNAPEFASNLSTKILQYGNLIPPPTPPGNSTSGNSHTQEAINKMYQNKLEQQHYLLLIQQL